MTNNLRIRKNTFQVFLQGTKPSEFLKVLNENKALHQLIIVSDTNDFNAVFQRRRITRDPRPLIYIPKTFNYRRVLGIKYLMKGIYPNLQNLNCLGILASIFETSITIHNQKSYYSNKKIEQKENNIKLLTGQQNISFSLIPYTSFETEVENVRGANILALSINNASIFETNHVTFEDVHMLLPKLSVPLIIF